MVGDSDGTAPGALADFLRALAKERQAEAIRLEELAGEVEQGGAVAPPPVARLESLSALPERPPGLWGSVGVPLARALGVLLRTAPFRALVRAGDPWRLVTRLRIVVDRQPIRHSDAQPRRWGSFVTWRSKYGSRKHELRLPQSKLGDAAWQELGTRRALEVEGRSRLAVLGSSVAPAVLSEVFDVVWLEGAELERELAESQAEVLFLGSTAASGLDLSAIVLACEKTGTLPLLWLDGDSLELVVPPGIVVLTGSVESQRALSGQGIAAQVVEGLSDPDPREPERDPAEALRLIRSDGARRTRALSRFAAHTGLPAIGTGAPLVSVICVSHRPERVASCVETFRRQTYPNKEFVFVANADHLSDGWLEQFEALGSDLVLLRTNSAHSLGESLNRARRVARGELWTKQDDDDHYGPAYLTDQVEALRRSGASVVGKGTYYTYLEAEDTVYLSAHAAENAFSERFVHGGTILADRRAVEEIDFLPVRRGTDSLFLQQCKLLGHRVYSSDRFNFAYMRYKAEGHHTYDVDNTDLRRNYELVRKGLRLDLIDI